MQIYKLLNIAQLGDRQIYYIFINICMMKLRKKGSKYAKENIYINCRRLLVSKNNM